MLQELLDSKHNELQQYKGAAADELAAAREAAAVAALLCVAGLNQVLSVGRGKHREVLGVDACNPL